MTGQIFCPAIGLGFGYSCANDLAPNLVNQMLAKQFLGHNNSIPIEKISI